MADLHLFRDAFARLDRRNRGGDRWRRGGEDWRVADPPPLGPDQTAGSSGRAGFSGIEGFSRSVVTQAISASRGELAPVEFDCATSRRVPFLKAFREVA
jgi:hypothetical protein